MVGQGRCAALAAYFGGVFGGVPDAGFQSSPAATLSP